ncbi:mechanosensitive ion channel [Candidatus Gracilibacteria bacterium]|nr:mechanosensitive ion channel [Candidatus Gracilibacteria bacterium]
MNFSLEGFDYTDINSYYELLIGASLSILPKIIGAILVFWIGFKVAHGISQGLRKIFNNQGFDPTVENFLVNLLRYILRALVILAVIGILGVQTSSFVALIAAAGFALGGALSGTLGHFASGIVILIFRPYKIGDIVEIDNYTGSVIDITVFSTKLQTVDTRIIIIPNNDAIGGSIVNYSLTEERQIDMDIGIAYTDNIDTGRKVLTEIAHSNMKCIIDEGTHPVKVVVKELGDNAVIVALRVWCKTEDYFAVSFELRETIKKEFDQNNLHFPFPQSDVHMYQEKS